MNIIKQEIERDRAEDLKLLERLLDVPGTTTPWADVEASLRRIPARIEHAIAYRIERAIAQAFDEGFKHGEKPE